MLYLYFVSIGFMDIDFKELNQSLFINLSGELDESQAKRAREVLDALIDQSKVKKVVIDMSELAFMDSSGLGVLLGRFKKLKALGIPLSIANPSKAVDKLLNLSGMYSFMQRVVF